MNARVRLAIAALISLATVTGTAALIATPAEAAKGSTDLIVTLANKPDAKPGKKITYTIVVRNEGKHAAARVQIVFKTSAGLKHLTYKISKGRCHRGPKRTTCLFGTVKAGKSATVRLTGTLSKNLKKGHKVTNNVTVASSTKLFNTFDDKATDDYQVGIPKVAPPSPSPSPSPSASSANKIQQVGSATAKVFDLSRSAATFTWVILAAAVAWFAIGLALRHRSRARRGFTNGDY